ncbi:MAG: hypothetical protein K0S56_3431 [Microvirga sp.]|jgi:hypothetical protein|nr:hypothetical protein [Microvirga sp.]
MSIANIICQGSSGYLLTDSGYFHPDGRLAFLRPKTLELPGLRVAIAARGHVYARENLGPMIAAASPSNQAELLGMLPDLLLQAMANDGAFLKGDTPLWAATTLYVVYYDQQRGRTGGLILSSSALGLPDDYEPFSYIPVTDVLAPGTDVDAALGRPVCLSDPHSFNVEQDGLAIAEAQRCEPWSFNGLPRAHYAAGEVRLTTVSSEGVVSCVIHSWQDRANRKVIPSQRAINRASHVGSKPPLAAHP